MKQLQELRERIDVVDERLLKALAERWKLAEEIGKLKKQLILPLEDKEREKEILEKRKLQSTEMGEEDTVFIEELFALLFKKSKEVQRNALIGVIINAFLI